MKFSNEVVIPAETELSEIPPHSFTHFYEYHYEAIIPLGKDASMRIIISEDGLRYLQKSKKIEE